MADILGAGISAGSGLIGSAINAISANVLANKQFKYSQQLAEQQNQYNIDMWRMNNEYNSPSAQMQRFAEAGLNPNLIYGQGNAGNSTHAPQAVVANPPDYSGVMSSMSRLAEALNIAKSIQEYRSLKIANDKKEKDVEWLNRSMSLREALLANQGINQSLRATLLRSMLKGYSIAGGYPSNIDAPDGVSRYFGDLYGWQFRNLQRQADLRAAQRVLYDLNVPYLRTRNSWQPWQYGISAGADVVGGLIGLRRLFAPAKQTVNTFNRVNNSTYNNMYEGAPVINSTRYGKSYHFTE